MAETVSEAAPVARSPIAPGRPEVVVAGWAVSGRRSDAALTITDCSPAAKVALKGSVAGPGDQAMSVPFGRVSRQTWTLGDRDDSVMVVGSGPGEWLVFGPPGSQLSIVTRLSELAGDGDDNLVSVVDLSHGRALVRLTGVRAADLLAKECAIDLVDAVCPDATAFRAAVAGLATDVIRDDRDGARSYLVGCERSSGQYLFDSLLDAGAEFGIEVDGFVPPWI